MKGQLWIRFILNIPFFLSCAGTMRPSDRYPIEVLSELFSSRAILEDEKEEDGEDEEGKESMLKLFFMATRDEDKSS